jgi:hypothetical protein
MQSRDRTAAMMLSLGPRQRRRRDLLLGGAGGLAAAGTPPPALAGVGEGLAARGWRELTFRDKEPNLFAAVEGEGDDGVRVESRGTVSVLYRDLAGGVDLAATPVLAWRWRVDEAPPATDLARKGGDDRALAVYVSFAFDPARAGAFERTRRAVLQRLAGRALPGRVLTYLWGGDGRAGGGAGWLDNPYLRGAGRMRVLRGPDAPLGRWFEERVDLAADHAAAFGRPPTAPEQVSISADTDDTASRAVGVVAGLAFRPRD